MLQGAAQHPPQFANIAACAPRFLPASLAWCCRANSSRVGVSAAHRSLHSSGLAASGATLAARGRRQPGTSRSTAAHQRIDERQSTQLVGTAVHEQAPMWAAPHGTLRFAYWGEQPPVRRSRIRTSLGQCTSSAYHPDRRGAPARAAGCQEPLGSSKTHPPHPSAPLPVLTCRVRRCISRTPGKACKRSSG